MVSELSDDNAAPDSHPDKRDAVSNASLAESTPSSFLWLTNRDQWLVVIVSAVVVVLLAVKWQKLRYVDRSEIIVQSGSENIGYKIDLNSATWVELTQLRDVGPVTAQRIVNSREEAGPFSSIDDLQRVDGIGPKTVEKNRRWLRFSQRRE
jgi:competence protein ComEA